MESVDPAGLVAHIRARSAMEGRTFLVLVDVADFDTLAGYTWWIAHDGVRRYPQTRRGEFGTGQRTWLPLTHLVLGAPPFRHARAEHINGRGLDCRRANLRWATQSQILAKRSPVGGSSRFKGVCWDRETGKWLVAFRGRKVGRFTDEEEAARAFDAAALAYWGPRGQADTCYLNFPEERRSGSRMTEAQKAVLSGILRRP